MSANLHCSILIISLTGIVKAYLNINAQPHEESSPQWLLQDWSHPSEQYHRILFGWFKCSSIRCGRLPSLGFVWLGITYPSSRLRCTIRCSYPFQCITYMFLNRSSAVNHDPRIHTICISQSDHHGMPSRLCPIRALIQY